MIIRFIPKLFEILLDLVRLISSKETTGFQEPIPDEVKQAVTLRYLSSGETYSHYLGNTV